MGLFDEGEVGLAMAPVTVAVTAEFGGSDGSDRLDGDGGGPVPLEVLERRLTSHAAHIAVAEVARCLVRGGGPVW